MPMTTNRPIITAYCLDWHLSQSSAFHDLLVKPLAPYVDIQMVAWDGHQDLPAPQDEDDVTIFCQMPPTEKWLEAYRAPVVWIPMADYYAYPPNMPHHPRVRMVAFSHEVATWAEQLGLPYLHLTYYLNPTDLTPVQFEGERVLLYWNRTGWFDKSIIEKLCHSLQLDRLLFRNQLDPRIAPDKAYSLPPKIGNTQIEVYDNIQTSADYMALLNRANFFLAPRRLEGVGMTLLEAMARGCVVLGYDAPTMNEYIQDGITGLLIRAHSQKGTWRYWRKRVYRALHRRYHWYLYKRVITYYDNPQFQLTASLDKETCQRLGATARQAMIDGYQKWIASIPAYAEFVIGKN